MEPIQSIENRSIELVQAGLRSIPSHEPSSSIRSSAFETDIAACRGKRIGVLVVTYNAVSTLKNVLKRIPPAVWENVEEIAVFDDASVDATLELAVGIKVLQDLPKLRIIHQPKNLGYGGNQKAGYRYFLDKGFDICVLLHGDGQYAPEMLAQMYRPIVDGQTHAVFGSRMMPEMGGPLKGGMPLYKFVGNKILTAYENVSLGMSLTEFHSGYRAYDLHALKQIDFKHMTDDFHFDTEIIIKLHHQNFRIVEIPIPTYYGNELCSVSGLKYAADVFRAVRRYKRTVGGFDCATEFAEFSAHYPIKASSHSSHEIALRLLGSGKDILDIGCGEGFFAAKVHAQGNRVTGVDCLKEPAHRPALEDYHCLDLETSCLDPLRGRYDYVLLLDVLEHLKNPERLLHHVRRLLKPGGKVVISVPNVANITVRLGLLFGQFNYQPRGILDRTHLRFFTRKTLRVFIGRLGFKSVKEDATVMPVDLALGLPTSSLLVRVLNRLLAAATWIWPGLLGYQIIHVVTANETHPSA